MNFSILKLSEYPNAFKLLYDYNKSIQCSLSDNELNIWIEKILNIGDPLAIVKDDKIIAFCLLYCNQLSTLEAYICNVYVNELFRGNKLSKLLIEEAIEICKSREFKAINLDVVENNLPAIKIYQDCGFIETNKYIKETDKYIRMTYFL